MTDFAGSTLRTLRRLFGARRDGAPLPDGRTLVLDGMSAVAAVEAEICESAGLGSGWPASLAARGWDRAAAGGGTNRAGAVRSSVGGDDARGALAAAIGLAVSGQRAVAFLNGRDLVGVQDLMMAAAQRHAPLVVHLASRATPRQGESLGGGHEAYHAVADAGWIQLFARNAQEAVDLALIARRVSELALVPVLVAMDVETAVGAEDVTLPGDALVQQYVGAPWDTIATPTPAQHTLFGKTRRRTPRWFDVDHPMLLSPACGVESWALGAAGARPFLAEHAAGILGEAFEEFTRLTRREYAAVSVTPAPHDILLLAQGGAVETASAVASWLRTHEKKNVGVLGARCLRPWPGAQIAGCLEKARTIAVLERVDAPLAGDGPLTREIRSLLDRCRENARYGEQTHAGYPSISEKRSPRVVTVPYGLGGFPLRAADLVTLADELAEPKRPLVYLGIPIARGKSTYPKRQALLDSLARDYPQLGESALISEKPAPELLPKQAVSLAVCRPAGRRWESLASDLATLAHELGGVRVRVEPQLSWHRFDGVCVDTITCAAEAVASVGADAPIDIVLDVTPNGVAIDAARLRKDACRLSADKEPAAEHAAETMLGSALKLILERVQRPAPTASKLKETRAAILTDLDDADRDARLAEFVRAFGEPLTPDTNVLPQQSSRVEQRTPAIARTIVREDTHVDALPAFWNQTGVLYRDGATAELSSDPYLATGAVPPLSGVLSTPREPLARLLDFDPQACDGSGRLWTTCPDASVAPLALSTKALIEAGIDLAAADGAAVDDLRGVVAALAKIAHKHVKSAEARGTTAGELLDAAFATLCEKSGFPPDREASLKQALHEIAERIGELPLARTGPSFDDAEAERPGSGELFALVINPDTCKCPQLVLEVCGESGLVACEPTEENVARLRRLWALWERLPDVSGATIERLRSHVDVGPLAAVMLSRSCRHALGPGDAGEAASGARLALRNVLGIAEAHLQPRAQQLLQRIDALRKRTADRIRELLAEALPTGDLEQLAGGLEAFGGDQVDLSKLADRVEHAIGGGRVDSARLRRIVEHARGLADLHWRLADGANNLGRSRFSLAIAGDSASQLFCVFPNNPFGAPAAVDLSGAAGRYAAGLIEGQLRQHLAAMRLLRAAQAELDRPNEAAHLAKQLATMGLDDLTDEERALIPPMIVVGDGRTFAERGLGELAWVLHSRLPIKVVVLSEAGGAADGGLSADALAAFPNVQRYDLAFSALLARTGFVGQVSLGAPEHFAKTTQCAFEFAGPALIHVHAPSAERHGFEPQQLLDQARLALESRAFPVFAFDPAAGGVFGSCLDLSGNPSGTSSLTEDGERRPTPVDWAAREARFAEHFSPLADDAPTPTPIAEYLELAADQRKGRTPFVMIESAGAQRRLAVGPILIEDADDRMAFWRVLQELAGAVTPFTHAVRERAERDLAIAHTAELDKMRAEHEAQLAELERSFAGRATAQVRDRLLQLAGYAGAAQGGKDNGA